MMVGGNDDKDNDADDIVTGVIIVIHIYSGSG